MKQLILAIAASVSVVALADLTTIYTCWTRGGKSSPKEYDWTDKDGNPVTMQNNGTEYAVVTQMVWSQGFDSGCDWNLNGLYLNNSDGSYADGSGIMGLQRGGLKCDAGCCFAMKGGRGTTFKLIAGPQTWEGPETGDYARIGTGDDGHNSYVDYHQGKLVASSDVYDWTVKGRLALWMFYENAISHVKLRMESPARIYLPTEWGSPALTELPKLGVKELTLAGEDVMWFAGVKTEAKLPMCNVAPTGVLNPMLDSETVAPKLILEGGADVQVENAIWDIPDLVVSGSGAKSAFLGDLTVRRETTNVELKDGASLEFASVSREQDVSASVTVTGTGTVRVDPKGWGLTGTLTLGDNVNLEVVGVNGFVGKLSGGKSLILDPGAGRICRLDKATYEKMSDKKIILKSGTLCLGAMSALPNDAMIEIAADAAVQFSSSDGYDAARVTGAGKDNVSFPANLVTDDVVTETEIVLNDGQVLSVAGDGLTAATTVKLHGGTLRFLTSAMVASPLSITRGSFVEAIDVDIVGTVTGAVISQSGDSGHDVGIPEQYGSSVVQNVAVNGLWTLGPGTVKYAGGGTFTGSRDPFVVTRDARVYLTGGTYDFVGGRGDSPANAMVRLQSLVGGKDYGYGRLLCICDGGAVTFMGVSGTVNECVYVTAPKNGGAYNLSPWISMFEIGAGGTVTIPSNGKIHLGSSDSHVQLKISGGMLKMDSDTAQLCVGEGSGTYGCATVGADILLEDGTLSLSSPIIREKGGDLVTGDRSARGRLIWTGGTLKLNEHFNAPTIFDISQALKDCTDSRVNGFLRQIARIDGTTCTLDLSEMGCASVANVPAGMNQSEWFGTGTLTVKGDREFVMNSFPTAMGIATAGTGAKVTVPPEACVYDNAASLLHWDVKMEDFGNPYDTRVEALASASIATLTSAGTNCAFVVTKTDLPFSVANVRVTGDWNNSSSVSAVGGLTIGDMTFADGSTLAAAVKGGGTVCQNITGTLTLPSSVRVRADRTADIVPTGVIALSADGGIVGSPTWIGTRGCKAFNDTSSVWIELSGMAIILR